METVRENVFNLDQGKRASSHQGQPRSLGCDSGFIEICNVPHRIGVACLCLHERDLTPSPCPSLSVETSVEVWIPSHGAIAS